MGIDRLRAGGLVSGGGQSAHHHRADRVLTHARAHKHPLSQHEHPPGRRHEQRAHSSRVQQPAIRPVWGAAELPLLLQQPAVLQVRRGGEGIRLSNVRGNRDLLLPRPIGGFLYAPRDAGVSFDPHRHRPHDGGIVRQLGRLRHNRVQLYSGHHRHDDLLRYDSGPGPGRNMRRPDFYPPDQPTRLPHPGKDVRPHFALLSLAHARRRLHSERSHEAYNGSAAAGPLVFRKRHVASGGDRAHAGRTRAGTVPGAGTGTAAGTGAWSGSAADVLAQSVVHRAGLHPRSGHRLLSCRDHR
mmetsp:Transcript_22645/g.50363  ORF Transcript_22645/g.50363 Transcript_22645/m.50363 type:complete len:298 (+) Transcript_22645:851-1744(+)